MSKAARPGRAAIAGIACVVALFLGGCASRPVQQENPASAPQPGQPTASTVPPALSAAPVHAAGESLPRIDLPVEAQALKPVDLTRETDDLFQRMRLGFSMPDLNNDLVLYHQQWYQNRPDYLKRIVERSSRYLHYIIEELDKRGMPTELALLPMVESAYNPMAYSRAKASGLWQFIPATGRRYKLDQNWWKDERRDIVASTAAALDYLQSIYEMHGDWHLALASYNWGEGAVARAISKNRAQGLPTDYSSLSMPAETRNYVPKLQALKNIFRNPALLAQLDLPKVANRPFFATVTTDSRIDVKLAARLAGMGVDEFVALNPAHNRPVIVSDSPLIIPAEKLENFVNNLEAHEESNKPLSSWRVYTFQSGDKLDKIARRFGMSLADLKEVNDLTRRSRVRPGMTLLVAANEKHPAPAAIESARLNPPASGPADGERSHLVRKGDTLLSIARKYGVSAAEIKRLNRLPSNSLVAGTRLQLGDKPAAKPATTVRAAKAPDNRKSGGKKKSTRYTVRRGDTLYSIARQYKVDPDDLMRWNRVSAQSLKPGSTLLIELALNP